MKTEGPTTLLFHTTGHWLGTGNSQSSKVAFLPFGEALVIARSLGLVTQV